MLVFRTGPGTAAGDRPRFILATTKAFKGLSRCDVTKLTAEMNTEGEQWMQNKQRFSSRAFRRKAPVIAASESHLLTLRRFGPKASSFNSHATWEG